MHGMDTEPTGTEPKIPGHHNLREVEPHVGLCVRSERFRKDRCDDLGIGLVDDFETRRPGFGAGGLEFAVAAFGR